MRRHLVMATLCVLMSAANAAPAGNDTGPVTGPVPAPPGPYVSSQPYLTEPGETSKPLPYYGAMEFPDADDHRSYLGPGRYWGPGADRPDSRPRFATVPTPPWGPGRFDGDSDDKAYRADQAAGSPPRQWGSMQWDTPKAEQQQPAANAAAGNQ